MQYTITTKGLVTLSKSEVRRRCNEIIEQRRANGEPVSHTLERWADNWPDERDREMAKRALNRPAVAAVVLRLRVAEQTA